MPDHKYNYIKPTLEKSTLSILSVDCSHRLSLAIINSFSKHKQRESLCYRIKTRFDTPAIRLKSPKKKKHGCGSWRGKSKIPETGSPRLCPSPLCTDKGRLLSPIFAFRPRFGRQSGAASPETLF